MTFSLNDVRAVLAEMAPACTGGVIQHIRQPEPHTLIVVLRQRGRSLSILISIHPRRGRLHILHARAPHSPPSPPTFCQYLRAHILGASIHRLVQTPHDRVVWFELQKHEDRFFLVAAFTGRSANLYVLDAQAKMLRSCKPEQSGGTVAGQPWTRFPVPWASDTDTDPASHALVPRVHVDRETAFPVSKNIEETYRIIERDERLENERRRQTTSLRHSIGTLQRRIERLTKDLETVGNYRDHGRYGELLKSQIAAQGSGHRHAGVIDYFDDTLPTLTLPLDPDKNGAANIAHYFKRHRKFTGAHTHLVPRLEAAQHDVAQAQRALRELEETRHTTLSSERTVERRAQSPRNPRNPRRPLMAKKSTAAPYRRFYSYDGHAILVGKNAGDNDTVTFKFSKPDDLWLHARGTPGSHVIVSLNAKQRVPPETLKDAATLALFYSDLRKSGKGDVIYTARKHVRKPKGASPGSVEVQKEKTVRVFVDKARLVRLKASGACASTHHAE